MPFFCHDVDTHPGAPENQTTKTFFYRGNHMSWGNRVLSVHDCVYSTSWIFHLFVLLKRHFMFWSNNVNYVSVGWHHFIFISLQCTVNVVLLEAIKLVKAFLKGIGYLCPSHFPKRIPVGSLLVLESPKSPI